MPPIDPMPQLGRLTDVEFACLAVESRKLALRGEWEAFGIAHALKIREMSAAAT